MRVLVTGSRGYRDQRQVCLSLAEVQTRRHRDELMTLIQGGAKGPDCWAELWAVSQGWNVEMFPADWSTDGKAAGPIRNQLMIDKGRPDRCLAFWDGKSKGTLDCIARCVRAGICVTVVPERKGGTSGG